MMTRPPLPSLPLALVIVAVLVMLAGVGLTLGLPLMLLGGAGALLVGVVLLFWTSVQSLTGSTPLTLEEALGLGAPSAEEERKQSILRALKDLEYERGVGKISEDDYQELSARYRAEAKQLLKALDRDLEPYRKKVLARLDAPSEAANRLEPSRDAAEGPRTAEAADAVPSDGRSCPECGTENDDDARFCKACATSLATPEDAP